MAFAMCPRMRWLGAFLLVVSTAWAHGGTFSGPRAPAPRGIPCDCARIECDKCANEALRGNRRITWRSKTTVVKRWHDIGRCRIRLEFETTGRPTEAYARLTPAPVFAAFAGSVHAAGQEKLTATLQRSQDTRRRYLFERQFISIAVDPVLVLRRGPGRVDVRAFPVSNRGPTVVTVDGYALLPPRREPARPVRLYRTGDRYLAIANARKRGKAHFFDKAGARALHFLSRKACRARFGTDEALLVHFVHALESAVTGSGRHATGETNVLAALAPGSRLPAFVGAGLDPEPPPPPPDP